MTIPSKQQQQQNPKSYLCQQDKQGDIRALRNLELLARAYKTLSNVANDTQDKKACLCR